MAKKKSTKKFEKNHLKNTLERRKEVAKIKQRHQVKQKKKARRAKEEAAASAGAEDGTRTSRAAQKKQKDEKASEAFKDMTVDEFFAGGFEIVEQSAKEGQGGKKVTGKRKRDAEKEEKESLELEDSSEEQPVLSDGGSESEMDGEGEAHKGDLEALAQKDPEFYKYLQENDAELLEFDENGELAGFGETSGDNEDGEEKPAKKKKKKSKERDEEIKADNEITLAMVERWQKSMTEQKSLRALKEVALAFRAAVRATEDEEKEFKYSISSAEVYHRLLTTTLRQIPPVIEHHIPIKTQSSGKVRVPTDSQKYKTLSPLLNSHAASLTYLLETLSDEKTLKLTLENINPLLPYFLSFRKTLKNFVRRLIDIWSASSSSETTRINAFLLIRRLAVIGDRGMRETLLKAAYQGLVKGSRNTTIHTISGINLMKNSAVDLWGTDYELGYTTGFTYIRQLAIHLRTTLTHPTKDSYKAIYNWQYIHSLDFWSRVFSTHCSPASNTLLKQPTDCPLHPLIYPLVQVTLGALRLIPTPTYFPLRFHLTRSLLRISRSTTTYIPLAPSLMEVLQSPEVKDSPKPSTLKPLDFPTILRAPKQYSRTRIYQDGLMEQTSDLLAEFFGVWAKSVAFPELIIPPVVLLKRWMKDVSSPNRHLSSHKDDNKKGKGKSKRPNPKITAPIALLIQKLNLNAEFIERHRRKLEFAPKHREQLKGFLKDFPWEETPMGAFVEGVRKQREERERVLEKGRRDDEDRRQKERRDEEREAEEDVEMEEGDSESESEGGVQLRRNGKQKGVEKSKKGKKGIVRVAEEDEDEEMEDWEDEDEEDDTELFDAEEGLIDDEAVEDDEDEDEEDGEED